MAQTAATTTVPGVERIRVRAQEILLGFGATALLALLGWLALSVVQVREDIVELRGEVALVRNEVKRNTEIIQQLRAEISRNTESLQRIESLLLADRDGRSGTPPRR